MGISMKYLRLATYRDVYYIRSECRAEMKRHCSYKIDICVDQDGAIVECQCECAAGQGPSGHCKHICTVLYALHMFSATGEISTERTCTQKLQTFHKSKPYTGSPIKACDMKFNSKESKINFDPRPQKYRKSEAYPYYFRAIWMNHPSVNSYPVSQMFTPANSYAVDADHDYLKLPLADHWLESQKITKVSSEDIQDLEMLTRSQSKSKDWKDEHSVRITSSSFGRICLATDRTDLKKIARSLTNNLQEIQSPPIRHGKKYESFALWKFEQKTRLQDVECL